MKINQAKIKDLLTAGVVITGGSSLLPGMVEVAEDVLGLPVRRGVPQGVGGLMDVVKSPIYATAVGLKEDINFCITHTNKIHGITLRIKVEYGCNVQLDKCHSKLCC